MLIKLCFALSTNQIDTQRKMLRINGVTRLFSRYYSCSKLFIGGLSYDTNETVLKHAFELHGELIEVKVICDTVSGRSKGFGFVRFTSEVAADVALKQMDGQLLDGRNIRVEHAQQRDKS